MRKFTALLLALVLLSMLCLAATAEEPADLIALEAEDFTLEDLPALGEADLAVPEIVEDLPVPEDADALSAPESEPARNAAALSKLELGVKESYTLKISDAKNYKSSKTKIATVSAKGVVKGKAVGSAKITVTLKDGSTTKVTVTVKKAPGKVTLDKTSLSLAVGGSQTLKATLPKNTASQKLTWTSSKKSVAKVDASGKVTALKAGTATITVTTFNGKQASCTVKVGQKVGISIPTKDIYRWTYDANRIKAKLVKAGYTVDLRYAKNDIKKQATQVEDMIDGGCSALIIAAIDSTSLADALQKAGEQGIPVIAYDRLIRDSDAVSYYITFDNTQVGALQGSYIRDALDLKNANGPFNLEITAGDPNDPNALVFYNGAMKVLKPYIKSGKLVVVSGQSKFKAAATNYWSTANAQTRAENILATYYADGTNLDAWLCSNDTTALGVVAALNTQYAGRWPIVTGQDCDVENVKNILAGKQSMSEFKDTGVLADRATTMATQLLKGKKVTVNDTKSFDNGAKIVPAYLCAPEVVTADNYKQMLIDSGFYTKAELK